MFIAHWFRLLPWRKARFNRPPLHREGVVAPEDERPLGCGWFDSSHDLQQGLSVQPAGEPDLAALPLSDWLTLHDALPNTPETSLDAAQGMMRAGSVDQGLVDEESLAWAAAWVWAAGAGGDRGSAGAGGLRGWH